MERWMGREWYTRRSTPIIDGRRRYPRNYVVGIDVFQSKEMNGRTYRHPFRFYISPMHLVPEALRVDGDEQTLQL